MRELSQSVSEENPKGIRVYRIKNVDRDIVALKGGPTRQQVRESESYQTLRENQSEFGAASKLAKSLRHSFKPETAEICGPYVSGKLTALIRNIIQTSEGEKGRRPILISQNKANFIGFDFDSGKEFHDVFRAKYYLKPGSTYGHFIFHCGAFTPEESLEYPEKATHFKLFTHAVSLSDMNYDHQTASYTYMESEGNGCSASEASELLPITRLNIEPFYFSISMGELCRKQSSHLSLALLMGIRFYRFENRRYESCADGNTISIVQMI